MKEKIEAITIEVSETENSVKETTTPPNTPVTPNNSVEKQAKSGPRLIKPEQMHLYLNNTTPCFFKVSNDLADDLDDLDSALKKQASPQ